MTNSRYLFIMSWLFVVFIVFSPSEAPGLLETAAPYTIEAKTRLEKAASRVPPAIAPKGLQQADEETKKKAVVNSLYGFWDNLYKEAGYSLEKSLVQVSKDFEANPKFLEENPQLLRTSFNITYNVYAQLANLNNKDLVVAKYLPHTAGEAFAKITRIEAEQKKLAEDRKTLEQAKHEQELRKQQEVASEEAKAKERALAQQREQEQLKHDLEAKVEQDRRAEEFRLKQAEQEDALKKKLDGFLGYYAFDNANVKGSLNIKSATEKEITFNIHTVRHQGGACNMDDQTATIETPGSFKSDLIRSKYAFKEGAACEVIFEFDRPKKGYVTIFQMGKSCKAQCSPAYVKMEGSYQKISDKAQ